MAKDKWTRLLLAKSGNHAGMFPSADAQPHISLNVRQAAPGSPLRLGGWNSKQPPSPSAGHAGHLAEPAFPDPPFANRSAQRLSGQGKQIRARQQAQDPANRIQVALAQRGGPCAGAISQDRETDAENQTAEDYTSTSGRGSITAAVPLESSPSMYASRTMPSVKTRSNIRLMILLRCQC